MPKRLKKKNKKIYAEIETNLCKDDKPLTRELAEQLLGWVEEEEENWGTDYLAKDGYGNKVRCEFNQTNRVFYNSNMESLVQEILRGRYRFNGEPIIIGESGSVLNGQHTLVALVIACQYWEIAPELYPHWKTPPTIDKLIVTGVEEDDGIINTMDTCKPRSLTDILYRSEHFKKCKVVDRKRMSRVCSYAIRTLWERLGVETAFSVRQTHSESFAFIEAHPRLLDAVSFVVVEDGDNNISKFISPGYAAGLMYLMGTSSSDPESYVAEPTEESLDFSNWGKAEEFITLLGGGAKEFKTLRVALGQLIQEDGGGRREKIALLVKAWEQFVEKGKIGKIELKYKTDGEIRTLIDNPSVGGIDLLEVPCSN